MARVTVEECLDNVENRFELVMLAARRARQLAVGGKDPLVKVTDDKPTVIALREIEAGFITMSSLDTMERREQAEREASQIMATVALEAEED